MTDWSRLSDYIIDFFPEPKYSPQDIRDWAQGNVPAWKHMSNKDKNDVVGDWENFIAPKTEKLFEGASRSFVSRIRRFLGRLF